MNTKNKIYAIYLTLAFAFISYTGKSQSIRYVDKVDPFIGTDDHGHTIPGAAFPGGMVQLSPDTGIEGWDWCSGYHYSDKSIMGFSHLHRSGMGAADWGDILLMPTVGKLKVKPGSKENPGEGYRSRFSHQEERASPGYYSVHLKDYNIKVQLTVSERAGFHQYTFPKSGSSHIIIDMAHGIGDVCTGSSIKIISNTEIAGQRSSKGFVKGQNVYFYAKFEKPFQSSGIWNGSEIKTGSTQDSGTQIGAFINYETTENERIQVKVGISYTGIEQAKLNLITEIPDWDFDKVKLNTSNKWESDLGKIEAKLVNNIKNIETVFYTALYHSLLFPGAFSDVDGTYMGLDNSIHKAANFTYRSDFSLWDTFRAEMPLLALIEPKRTSDVINTMFTQYEQGGWLPIPQQFGNTYTNDMIGDHPVSVILDAYRKGIRGFDVNKVYEAVKKNALEVPPTSHPSKGRSGLEDYIKYGYLPYDKNRESVSKTLEYAYDDWCIAQLAKELGKEEDYKIFMKRALNYKNLFDSSTGFARPKNSNGKWLDPFDPGLLSEYKVRHYTEGNAWQYTWFVPHDVQGLINNIGGNTKFISKLDSLFIAPPAGASEKVLDVTGLIGQYAHGNEPGHHTTYLYNYAGAPWKTQESVRRVMSELYNSTPSGLCGNEDMGQMSAWYVLSAMGFYPVTPGQNTWVIGSPIFDKVVIKLNTNSGKNEVFTIEAKNNSTENKYIQSATLNGKPLTKPWFDKKIFENAGNLIFQMGPKPNKNWGISKKDAPPSMSKNLK